MPAKTLNYKGDQKVKGMNSSRADDLIGKHKELVGLRSNFMGYWQSLHDYFYVESPDLNAAYSAGSELNTNYLFDSTTLETADVLASGFMNYLTPPSSKWFKLRAKNPILSEDKEISDYLETVEREVFHTLNKSNFYQMMFPSYKASGVYGTSVLLEEEDLETDARFISIPLKQCVLVEDAQGRIAEYYIEFEYTAYQAASKWGEKALSQPMRDELKGRPNKKHKFLLFIGKRNYRDVTKGDSENMPIEAVWVDVEGRKIIDEGGYNEFPVMSHRFDKRPFIPWGFSPAMKALPFARLLNAISKTNLRSMMKATDPPIAIPNNAFIMPFNANPRAINYYNKNNMESGKDIFPFANYGDPNAGLQAIEYYSQKVKSLMFHDVFLAFNNITKQMNNPEIQERINEKMTMLGPAVGRYTGEVLNPIVIRTIGILYRRGKLPPPPDALLQDPSYEIDYVSQLAQSQKRSQLTSLVTALDITGQMAQYAPDVLDGIDPDKARDEVWDIVGAPVRVLRDDKEIQAIREGRAQQQMEEAKLMAANSMAQTGKTAAEGDKVMAETAQVGK